MSHTVFYGFAYSNSCKDLNGSQTIDFIVAENKQWAITDNLAV